jgi:hypothetical protein
VVNSQLNTEIQFSFFVIWVLQLSINFQTKFQQPSSLFGASSRQGGQTVFCLAVTFFVAEKAKLGLSPSPRQDRKQYPCYDAHGVKKGP